MSDLTKLIEEGKRLRVVTADQEAWTQWRITYASDLLNAVETLQQQVADLTAKLDRIAPIVCSECGQRGACSVTDNEDAYSMSQLDQEREWARQAEEECEQGRHQWDERIQPARCGWCGTYREKEREA